MLLPLWVLLALLDLLLQGSRVNIVGPTSTTTVHIVTHVDSAGVTGLRALRRLDFQ